MTHPQSLRVRIVPQGTISIPEVLRIKRLLPDMAYLKFDPGPLDGVLNEGFRITIRVDLEREFKPGERFEIQDADGNTVLEAIVGYVGEMNAARAYKWVEDSNKYPDFRSRGAFFDSIRGYYPEKTIKPSTRVTVIEFTPITGTEPDPRLENYPESRVE